VPARARKYRYYMFKKMVVFFVFMLSQSVFAEEEAFQATESYEYAFFKMLATLGVLVLFLIISFWMFRRLTQGRLRQMNQGRAIQVIERRSLSPKTILYVISYSGKEILLTESQLEVRKIDEKMREAKDLVQN
jgi:flagellar biogenesis protein FliO